MNYKVIFHTSNHIQCGVRWKQEVTDSGTHWQSLKWRLGGICSSMVAKWLQKSLVSGHAGVQSVDELGSEHLMAINASAFNVVTSAVGIDGSHLFAQTFAMLESYNVSYKYRTIATNGIHINAVLDIASVWNEHFGLMFRYTREDNSMGAHMVGFRHDHEIFQYFDPNFGLIEYPDKQNFKDHLRLVIFTDQNKKHFSAIQKNPEHHWAFFSAKYLD